MLKGQSQGTAEEDEPSGCSKLSNCLDLVWSDSYLWLIGRVYFIPLENYTLIPIPSSLGHWRSPSLFKNLHCFPSPSVFLLFSTTQSLTKPQGGERREQDANFVSTFLLEPQRQRHVLSTLQAAGRGKRGIAFWASQSWLSNSHRSSSPFPWDFLVASSGL